MLKALPDLKQADPKVPTIGVFATSDPRIDAASRERCVNIVEHVAKTLASKVKAPAGGVKVVWSPVLVDGKVYAVSDAGDVYARCEIRNEEMRQSARIIEQCLDGMPEGEHTAKVAKVLRPPAGEVYAAVESPRGELGVHLVSDGTDSPYRMRYRPPALFALQAGEAMLPGGLIADAVVTMGSMDLILGEIDR